MNCSDQKTSSPNPEGLEAIDLALSTNLSKSKRPQLSEENQGNSKELEALVVLEAVPIAIGMNPRNYSYFLHS